MFMVTKIASFILCAYMLAMPIVAQASEAYASPTISEKQLYEYDIAGVKLGMTPDEVDGLLKAKGYVGSISEGNPTANGNYFRPVTRHKHEIEEQYIYVQYQVDPADTASMRAYKIEYNQRFDSPPDFSAWAEKTKKRYGSDFSREADEKLIYSVKPVLKSTTSETYCEPSMLRRNQELKQYCGFYNEDRGRVPVSGGAQLLMMSIRSTQHLLDLQLVDGEFFKKSEAFIREYESAQSREKAESEAVGF